MVLTTEFYDSMQKAQEEKIRHIRAKIPEIIDKISFGLVLDIGCGTGIFQKKVPGTYVGIDIDEKMLRKSAAMFPRVLGDGRKLPFGDYSFDAVISVDTMHLVNGTDFQRVLKPGGLVLLSTFFNDENFEEKKEMILSRIKGLRLIEEFTINTKEKEYVVCAEKQEF